MSAAEQFPNATARPWDNVVVVVRTIEGHEIHLWQLAANGDLAKHAVNTYDAREKAIRDAVALLTPSRGWNRGDFSDIQEARVRLESVLPVDDDVPF